jgi:hypothetical protein
VSRARDRLRARLTGGRSDPAQPAPPTAALPGPAERVAAYAAVAELARRCALPPADAEDGRPRGDLSRHELKVFSQNGEDGVLAEILRRLPPGAGTFVDIGAGDGVEGNCVALADVLGWSGVMVEADDVQHAALERKYATNRRVTTVCARVDADNAGRLLRGVAPAEPDVLSIDIDGLDWWVWRELALRPRVVVVEYNAHLGFDRALTVPREHRDPWDGTDYFGASLPAFELLAEHRGYRLVHTDLTGVNAFFVRTDLDALMPAPDRVPRRAPNLLLAGISLPPDPRGRRYAEVSEGLTGEARVG